MEDWYKLLGKVLSFFLYITIGVILFIYFLRRSARRLQRLQHLGRLPADVDFDFTSQDFFDFHFAYLTKTFQRFMNTAFEKLNTLTSVRDDVERMMAACECNRDGCPYERIEKRVLVQDYTTLMHGCCVAEIDYAEKKALQLYD